MKKKNGFTLIELLAIIVILAIIAVITVPIILNVIDNAERGSAEDSALGYKDALQKYYATKLVQVPDQELPSGYVEISELPSDFTVSGEKPSDGWVKLKKGKVERYSLKYKNFVVSMNNDKNVISEKQDKVEPHVPNEYQEVEYLESTGTQYIDTGYVPQQNDYLELKNVTRKSEGALFSAGTGDYQLIYLYSGAQTNYFKFFATGSAVNCILPNSIDSRNIKVYNNNLYIDDQVCATSDFGGDVNTDLRLFARKGNTNYIGAQIGNVIIKSDNTFVRNLVPVIRKSDGKPGMLDLTATCKNLVPDVSNWENGYISAIGGISGMNNVKQEKTSPFIEIDSITNITFSLDSGVFPSIGTEWEQSGWRTFGFYDENKSFISRVGGNGENALTVTVPSNAKYFRISMRTFGKNENVMLNEGSTALPYEPYKKSFYTNDGTGEFIAGPEI